MLRGEDMPHAACAACMLLPPPLQLCTPLQLCGPLQVCGTLVLLQVCGMLQAAAAGIVLARSA